MSPLCYVTPSEPRRVIGNIMLSTMMHTPLGVPTLFDYGRRHFASSRIGEYDGATVRWQSYGEIEALACRLASALGSAGLRSGDRVGTFLWNSAVHLGVYLCVPSMGGVMHTLNCRLAAEQISYIINHAGDRYLIVDGRLEEQLVNVLPQIPDVQRIIVVEPMGLLANDDRVISLDAFLAGAADNFEWPEIDENQAAGICYTSGTTGNPKGIVYSQKTTYLHALASRSVDSFGVCERDTILMLPSMFHANAWGFPYSGWMSGADMIMPGPHTQIDHLRTMIQETRPTLTALVPTILGDLLRADDASSLDLSCFRAIVCGGSAVPSALIESVRARWDVPVIQGWGMTETSPMCVLSHPPKDLGGMSETSWRIKSGRPVPGISVRIVDQNNQSLPQNGEAIGELQLRGAWVAGAYLNIESDAFTTDGWLRTGDLGCIDEKGYVQLTDRIKDVIKSGGEWISSLDLEDAISQHSGVAEVAVISIPDERWQERPLAIVVRKSDSDVTPADLRSFLADRVARFWIPEYWCITRMIDKTSVGKFDKKKLRDLLSRGDIVAETVRD